MRLTFAVLTFVIVSAAASNAQETGQVGLTMAFPAAIGAIWQATDRLAIRPDFTFAHSEAGGNALVASNNSTGIGLSALFYVGKWDNLRAYLSPRFGYQRSSQTLGSVQTASGDTHQYSFAGSIGAEYQLHRRFAVFAETGVVYSQSSGTFSSVDVGTSLPNTSKSWATRAGIGAVLYF
jgi:hypothetical protein